MMNSINVLKIFSSLLLILFLGCSTLNSPKKRVWPLPDKPKLSIVHFDPINENRSQKDGYYMSKDGAKILADNIDEMKAYSRKLELLVGKMVEYYGDKAEDYFER